MQQVKLDLMRGRYGGPWVMQKPHFERLAARVGGLPFAEAGARLRPLNQRMFYRLGRGR